jgi:hypothetical protein
MERCITPCACAALCRAVLCYDILCWYTFHTLPCLCGPADLCGSFIMRWCVGAGLCCVVGGKG